MTAIETIKAVVSPADAAVRYGLKVGSGGMALCPFHDDHEPSLMLYRDHYHCFGCGAHGDVINFTAALFDLSFHEAVDKLACDFGITTQYTSQESQDTGQKTKVSGKAQRSRNREWLCFSALLEDLDLLQRWKQDYAPKTPDEPVDDRYVMACQKEGVIEYYTNILCSGSRKEKTQLMDDLLSGNIRTIARSIEKRQERDHEQSK